MSRAYRTYRTFKGREVLVFKTDRTYSPKGQRIAAAEIPDGRVMFADVDRGIDGITTITRHRADTLDEHVMWCYDRGHYLSGVDLQRHDVVEQGELMAELIRLAEEL
jgi:hypothetical protein